MNAKEKAEAARKNMFKIGEVKEHKEIIDQ